MDNLGEYIRRQREAKNLTIEELSAQTKISVAILRDIENGKFDRYKGDEAYVKMYLKKITNILNMDTEMVTQQYVELTREIALEDVKEKEEKEQHNDEVVKKGRKFSFEAPQLARKPSVYEDKSHVTIIRGAIILILVCLVIVVIWYGFYATRSQTKDPEFVPQNQPTVEGDVNTDDQQNQNNDTNTNNNTTTNVDFTRNGRLDFNFKLPEGTEEFTLKIEYNRACWAQMSVNGKSYDEFVSKVYHDYTDENKPDTVELTFKVADFENLRLRNGNNVGHHFYINNQEVPLIEEDSVTGPANLKLTLEKE
ncbi:helix-turn-helix domain-containing protein [Candidatus Stoquefichus sp. SB1]|uniref:helix-turn-helix domain-containing protein n=1 Tax=Candidatus Stoquefichus sp. SB1 TaxID=1658109 RepID=UPI00067E6D85|nr:helix-turn-helix domain-containing protein [Candidatus Stoquefichus sp. SB1]